MKVKITQGYQSKERKSSKKRFCHTDILETKLNYATRADERIKKKKVKSHWNWPPHSSYVEAKRNKRNFRKGLKSHPRITLATPILFFVWSPSAFFGCLWLLTRKLLNLRTLLLPPLTLRLNHSPPDNKHFSNTGSHS